MDKKPNISVMRAAFSFACAAWFFSVLSCIAEMLNLAEKLIVDRDLVIKVIGISITFGMLVWAGLYHFGPKKGGE